MPDSSPFPPRLAYALDETVMHLGAPYEICSIPFVQNGETWQNAADASGRTVTVPTPATLANREPKYKNAWRTDA